MLDSQTTDYSIKIDSQTTDYSIKILSQAFIFENKKSSMHFDFTAHVSPIIPYSMRILAFQPLLP